MTIEELEKLARTVADKDLTGRLVSGYVATDLARALLAVLPVVKAAEALRTVHDADELTSTTSDPCDCALCAAVDQMRKDLP